MLTLDTSNYFLSFILIMYVFYGEKFVFILEKIGIYFQYNVLPQLFFYSVFLYSSCEMTYNKFIKALIPIQEATKKESLDFVQDGKVVYDYLFTDKYPFNINFLYDFIIYSRNKDKIILKGLNNYELDGLYKQANFKIIMAEIYYPNDTNFKIQFYKDEYNYFMVDNLLDNNFMKYFLTKHYSNEINKYEIKDINHYEKIYIIDQNADFLNVSPYQAILVHDDNIEIIELPSFSNKVSENIQFDNSSDNNNNDSSITDTESNNEDSENNTEDDEEINDATNEKENECVANISNDELIIEEEKEKEQEQENIVETTNNYEPIPQEEENNDEINSDSFVNVEENTEIVNNLSSYVDLEQEIVTESNE